MHEKAANKAGSKEAQRVAEALRMMMRPPEQAIEAMFLRPSPQELYRTQTRHAAALERAHQYSQAQRYWLEAGTHAACTPDRHWCESRAAWCGRQSAGDDNRPA